MLEVAVNDFVLSGDLAQQIISRESAVEGTDSTEMRVHVAAAARLCSE
jgi:hypothetical protein